MTLSSSPRSFQCHFYLRLSSYFFYIIIDTFCFDFATGCITINKKYKYSLEHSTRTQRTKGSPMWRLRQEQTRWPSLVVHLAFTPHVWESQPPTQNYHLYLIPLKKIARNLVYEKDSNSNRFFTWRNDSAQSEMIITCRSKSDPK